MRSFKSFIFALSSEHRSLAKVASGVPLEDETVAVATDGAPKEPELVKPVKPAKEEEA